MRATMTFATGNLARAMRLSLGLSQIEFWTPLGVVQSWASRYEAADRLPKTIQLLLEMAYGSEEAAEQLMRELRDSPRETLLPAGVLRRGARYSSALGAARAE